MILKVPAMRDLNDLQFFALVVRHGGFSAAERATGIVKSKLSKRVATLEQDLGARLLERSTKTMRLTEVGRDVFAQCESILSSVEETETIIARARNEVSGKLRVCAPPSLPYIVGPGVTMRFITRHPLVRMELVKISRRVDLIAEGFDVAFRIQADPETDLSLTTRTLGTTHLVLVAAPSLVEGRNIRSIDDLAQLPTLSTGDGFERDRWELTGPGGEVRSFIHAPRLCTEDVGIVKAMSIAGLGVALLPEDSCVNEVRDGALLHLLPKWSTPGDNISLVFTTSRGMSSALRAFVDHCVDAFAVLRNRERVLIG